MKQKPYTQFWYLKVSSWTSLNSVFLFFFLLAASSLGMLRKEEEERPFVFPSPPISAAYSGYSWGCMWAHGHTGIGEQLYTLSNSLLYPSVYEKMWVLIRSEDVFAYVLLGMHTPTGDRARQKKKKEEERGGKK